MKQIRWIEDEVYLLVETYLDNKDKGDSKIKLACSNLSITLRQLAIDKDMEIDEIYRNDNGIYMQFQTIEYIYTDGLKGFSAGSILAKKVVAEYKSNPDFFFEKLAQIKAKNNL